MKRPWAVLLIACLLASCRSSQPATNPFMRTTVPPPATTPGVVVTPGEPYAAGISPPVVTTPVPATPPPVVTQPAVAAPPPAPIAPQVPQGDKFNPPGGSYLYHQSSNQPVPSASSPAGTQLAVTAAPGGATTVAFNQPAAAAPSTAVQPAAYVAAPYVQPTTATIQAPIAQGTPGAAAGDPPESATKVTISNTPQNTIRIVSPATPAAASTANVTTVPAATPTSTTATFTTATPTQTPAQTPPTTTLQVTAGGASPTLKTTFSDAQQPANLSIAPGTTSQTTTATFVTPAAASGTSTQTATQAGFRPASGGATSDYFHAADYSTLRGELEYSQTTRQWKLRYIPIDGQTDDFGGSVVLNDSPALASFQPGDKVAVRGLVAGAGGAGFSPRYTLTAIERAGR